jgi:small subunit ribosomal protein S12
MSTLGQLCKTFRRKQKKMKDTRLHLEKCPQKRATCLKLFLLTPRKPNSALRKVSRVILSNYRKLTAYIPGKGHKLQKHSVVLVRGGRVKDLPGIKYTLIRGKFDLRRLENRRNSRSKYGTPKVYKGAKTSYQKYRF